VRFYIRGYDQHLQIGPMSLSAAESVVRAMALAQRSKGSRVWMTNRASCSSRKAGCALDALWIADEH